MTTMTATTMLPADDDEDGDRDSPLLSLSHFPTPPLLLSSLHLSSAHSCPIVTVSSVLSAIFPSFSLSLSLTHSPLIAVTFVS